MTKLITKAELGAQRFGILRRRGGVDLERFWSAKKHRMRSDSGFSGGGYTPP